HWQQFQPIHDNSVKAPPSCIAYVRVPKDGYQSCRGHCACQLRVTLAQDAETQALKAADMEMMKNMDLVPYTGNPDVDFRLHMIPHHEGQLQWRRLRLNMPRMSTRSDSLRTSSIRSGSRWPTCRLAKSGRLAVAFPCARN